MFFNLQINRSLVKNQPGMDGSKAALSEEALQREWEEIQAAQADPARFRPLYERYFEPIFRFLFRRTADEALTADLASQVFLKALQKLHRYEYRGVPFSAWLFRIAQNELNMHFRQNRNQQRVVSIQEVQLDHLMDDLETDQLEPYREVLIQALEQLPKNDLKLLELRYFEQRSYREVAGILNITENNAKVRAHRIAERLRKIIMREYEN